MLIELALPVQLDIHFVISDSSLNDLIMDTSLLEIRKTKRKKCK